MSHYSTAKMLAQLGEKKVMNNDLTLAHKDSQKHLATPQLTYQCEQSLSELLNYSSANNLTLLD